MCFKFKTSTESSKSKTGKNVSEPKGLKPNLSTSRNKADVVTIPATDRRNEQSKPTDKVDVNGKRNRTTKRKPPPLSSTPVNEDPNSIHSLVHHFSMNELFRKLLEQSSEDLRLDQR